MSINPQKKIDSAGIPESADFLTKRDFYAALRRDSAYLKLAVVEVVQYCSTSLLLSATPNNL